MPKGKLTSIFHSLIVPGPILVVDCWWQPSDSIRVTYLAKY
jgi:hypothetical protein